MNILGYEFAHLCEIQPALSSDGSIQAFMPQARYLNAQRLGLHPYGTGPFCKFSVPALHKKSGVYLFADGDEVKYVGECVNLSARFNNGYGNISPRNCYKGGQHTNCRINNIVHSFIAAGGGISLWFHPTHDYKFVERELRSHLRAVWNRV